jgi:pSer/pThr/pTyr-binding forkhead associated (FHA) protein
MSTYDENVRPLATYQSFAGGRLEDSPGGTVEELPLADWREAGTPPTTPPATPPASTPRTPPATPGFAETSATLALRRADAASAAPAFIKLVEGTDLTFGRGPRADVPLVDAARRAASRRQFVSRRHARIRTATRWGEAVAVLKAFRRRDGRARCGVFVDGEAVGDEPVRLRAGHRVVFGSLADDDGTPYSEFAYDVVTCGTAPEDAATPAPDLASPGSVGSFGDLGEKQETPQRRGRLSTRRRRISLAVAVVRDDRDGLDDETDDEDHYAGVCELAPAGGCFAGIFDGESLLFGGSKEET